MTEITSLVLGPLETNCYFLRDTETGDLVIFDPAWYEPALEQAVQKAGKGAVKGIVLTHCHFDHMMGAAQLKKLTGAPIWLPVQESGFPADPTLTLAYMVPGGLEPFEADGLLSEGKPLSFGSLSLRPIHTPGHTIGSHCFLIDDILVAVLRQRRTHGSSHGEYRDDHAVSAPSGGIAGRLPRIPGTRSRDHAGA